MENKKRFLFILTERGGGDRPPVIALAVGLKARGHDVLMLCDQATKKMIASTGLPTRIFPRDLDQRGQISHWFTEISKGEPANTIQPPNPLSVWARPLLEFGLDIAGQFRPDWTVSTLFGMGLADLIRESTGTPWCFVNPSFYFGKNATTRWEEDWYGPYIPRLARDCFWPLAEKADLVLHATDAEFDNQPTQLPENHHYVGFLLWEPSFDASYVPETAGEPWVLITLSSVKQENEVEFANAALQALANQPVRSLLTQPDDDIREQLENIPANATIAGFVPHGPILQKSALVINHAGHGIVSKALYHGVPMVLLPWDRDQPGVAARAKKLGVARVIPRNEATPERVKMAIEALRTDEETQAAARFHSERLSSTDSVAIACSLIEGF